MSSHEPTITAPSHTRDIFEPVTFRRIARWAAKCVRASEADAIVVCGQSGLILAGAVSWITGVPVIAVRKDGEPTVARVSHNASAVLKDGPAKRWVFLDDLVASGGTLSRCAVVCEQELLTESFRPAALLLYAAAHTGRSTKEIHWGAARKNLWGEEATRFPTYFFQKDR